MHCTSLILHNYLVSYQTVMTKANHRCYLLTFQRLGAKGMLFEATCSGSPPDVAIMLLKFAAKVDAPFMLAALNQSL